MDEEYKKGDVILGRTTQEKDSGVTFGADILQRMINEWNKLPTDCVNASSVNMFKNRIDRYLIRAGYT